MPGIPWDLLFRAEIDNVSVAQLDEESVVFVPSDYEDADAGEDPEPLSQRIELTSDASRVWKSTVEYGQIAEAHPRLARF